MAEGIVLEAPGLYRVIALTPFRKTPGVAFDIVPMEYLPALHGIDRVVHDRGAISPGAVAGVAHPWYMHPHQEDNLLVLHGRRTVELYTRGHGRVETFVVEPERLTSGGRTVCDRPALLMWPRLVFHRITSGDAGSVSLNFAVRDPDCDMKTNFNIYDLDTANGAFKLIREGYLDQNLG
jgi:hypothetical protein